MTAKLTNQVMREIGKANVAKVFVTTEHHFDTGGFAAGMGCHAILNSKLSDESLFSSIHSAFFNFERKKEFDDKRNELEFKLNCRKFIVLAEVQLIKWFKCSEEDAYKMLRTSAMNKHVQLEEICIDLLSNPEDWLHGLKRAFPYLTVK